MESSNTGGNKKNPNTQSEVKKLRVLCLHGFLTNSTIMEMQMREWMKFLGRAMDFEFLNGQYEVNVEEVIDVRITTLLKSGMKSYGWFQISPAESYEGRLINDAQYLVSHLLANGPYDGIIGFSQGGAVTNLLMKYLNEGLFPELAAQNKLPKFIMIINGVFLTMPAFTSQFSIPSIHFVSQEDELYNKQVLMTTFYRNSLVIEHSYGHKVPRLSPREYKAILSFITAAVKQASMQKAQNNNKNNSIPLAQKPNL